MSRWYYLSRLIPVTALGFTWATSLPAQGLTNGSLAGVVTGEDGAPVVDARIWVTDSASGITRSVLTTREGAFRIAFLPPGGYVVLVERLGYRPRRIEAVTVRAGVRTELDVVMAQAQLPVNEIDVDRFGGSSGATRPGLLQRFSRDRLMALPEVQREIDGVARLFSASAATLESEGLPARYGSLIVDGLPFASAWHPDAPSASLRAAAFPLSGFEDVELVAEAVDVELAGSAGGYVVGTTRRGTRVLSTSAFGAWSGDAVASSSYFDPAAQSFAALQGGMLLSGPIVRDTAAFILGVELRRDETPLPQVWGPAGAVDALLAVARDRFGVDLRQYSQPRLLRSDAVSLSGRFDWRLGATSAVQVRGSLAAVPEADPVPAGPWSAGPGATFEGRDLSLAATLTTEFDERLATEIRVGYEGSLRDFGMNDGVWIPVTRFAQSGFVVGTDASFPGRFEQSALRLGQALHLRSPSHDVKVGAAAVWSSYDHTFAHGRAGEFVFADAVSFAAGHGVFAQATGPLPVARFDVSRYGVFLQDRWRAGPGLEITAGLRYDVEAWPADRVRAEPTWLGRTGLGNTDIGARRNHLSPRIGLTWDVQEQGRWRVDLAAGIHHQAADPAILAELMTHDGRVDVRRAVGDLDGWPSPPPASVGPVLGPRLTLLGPSFESPRTTRGIATLTHRLSDETTFSVSGTARRTDFLPRRTDLNRLPLPAGEDQFGRPVFGRLVQDRGLIVAAPGSNRRFGDFDVVSALNADGRSEHLGLTLTLDRWNADVFGFTASYTHSGTTDNWLGARHGGPDAQLHPFPRADGADWADGVSDFDVPHRLVAIGELRLPAPLRPRVAGVYRFRSGYPFTPGFRDGVDVNGDGSGRNDPAFIDETVPGVTDLLAAWDCLRIQAGRFAERNACREPGVHGLDLRLTLGVLQSGRHSAELVIDALNVVESRIGVIDRAVYLVDPDAELRVHPVTGRTEIPLVANPGFGQLLARQTPGRALRLGFRLTY